MQRKPSPRALTAVFLAVSAAISVVLLSVRNLYDDEIFSLDLITSPVAKILSVAAEGDVHPPGMYLLAHWAYGVVPSFRWINLFPLLLVYVGLAYFLVQVTPLFARARERVCLLLLATLHPQLLMWGGTFRWYGWWTGLALIALTAALQPKETRPLLGVGRAAVLGLLLAGLFYLNYVTFLFASAMGAAMVLRYREQGWRRLLARGALMGVVFGALAAPQMHTMMTVHMAKGQLQRYGVAVSFLRLVQSIAMSEAYLPWHPLAIAAGMVFVILCAVGVVCGVGFARRRAAGVSERGDGLAAILLFGGIFFLLVAGSGLGGKPRNGLLLISVLAPAAALVVGTLRRRAQDGVLLFFALWSGVGIAHLLGRYGLTKSFMIDRPEEVVRFVAHRDGADCAVVVTFDGGMEFALAQAKLPRVLVVSPFRSHTLGSSRELPRDCVRTRLYAVESYMGGSGEWVSAVEDELQSSTHFIEGGAKTDRFSYDPDAGRKRQLARLSGLGTDLASVARLPDYRYVVVSGAMDAGRLRALRLQMPDFLSGFRVSVDEEVGGTD